MIVTGIPMTYRHYVPHSFCTSENTPSTTFVNKAGVFLPPSWGAC